MKKKDIITFIVVFCTAIISTLFFLKPHYSIDTIEFLRVGYESYIRSKFLLDGRIFSVGLLKIVIDMPMQCVIPILYVIGILISCLAVMYIRKWIIKYVKSEDKLNIIPTLIAYVIVFNFMYIDTFQFMEFPIIALSVLLYIIAAKIVAEKKKGYILKSFMLTLIAMFCYQGTINVFIATTFVISIIEKRKFNKDLILDIIKAGMISLIAIGINYCFIRMVGENSRVDFNIIENCKKAFMEIYSIIFDSGNQYYPFLQLIFVFLIIIYCYVKKVKISNLIWIYIVSIMANMIILIGTNERSVGVGLILQHGRIFFTAGSSIGYMLMYLWCVSDEIRKSKFIKIVSSIYVFTVLIIYFQYCYMYMKGQSIDEYIIKNIDEVISKYENETGIKVEKYSYTIDVDNYEIFETTYFLNKKYSRMNYATIYTGRRTKEYIGSEMFLLYADRKIEKVYIDDSWKKEHIENTNFSQMELFDERRFIFVGDTVYFVL